jgi:hypothetical protein
MVNEDEEEDSVNILVHGTSEFGAIFSQPDWESLCALLGRRPDRDLVEKWHAFGGFDLRHR